MIENIKCVTGAPSVQMQEVPPDFMCLESLEDQEDPDGRHDDESRSVKEPKGRGGIDQVGQEERVKEGEKSRGWEIEEGGGGKNGPKGYGREPVLDFVCSGCT